MRRSYTIRCSLRTPAQGSGPALRIDSSRIERRNLLARSDDFENRLNLLDERLAGRPGLRVERRAPLGRLTTLRIGGPAGRLVEAGSELALAELARAVRDLGLPLFLLGLGANVLVPDEGLPGVVVRLAGGLRRFAIRGERVSAGAGVVLATLARRTAERGLSGLEAFAGFPSTVGGAVVMNAGCYGREVRDVLVSVRLVEPDGARRRLATAELEPGYRRTNLAERGALVTRAHFLLERADREMALARIAELNARRRVAMPSGAPNAGSVFKNPPGDFAGRLLEAAGLKGRHVGGARVSERHANVIENARGATANDVLALMLECHRAVAARDGIFLEPEWVLAGALERRWREETGR